jgi:hypothetical protein
MDDVSYMRSRTVQESYMFMVDSRNRDRAAHPEPSEYTIEFAAPFRNVCSFSLVDVTIPRTQYSVDIGSNTLRYKLAGDPETFEVEVPPGDYTLPQLCDALNRLLYGGLTIEPESTPYELRNLVRIYRTFGGFTLLMGESGLRTALGFPPRTFVVDTQTSHPATAHAGPYVETQTLPVSSTERVRQQFVAQASGTVEAVTVGVLEASSPTLRVAVQVTTATGEVVATGTVAPMRTQAAVLDPGAGELVAGETYWLEATANEPGAVFVALGTNTGVLETGSATSWTAAPDPALKLCCEVTVGALWYQITGPNLVDITGDKVVLIRCPEIETVMFRERFNEKGLHVGLGYVKTGGLGFREQRSDYYTPFPPRTFHPISKLSKLTIRLENPDGTLYQTRGVDHVLLMNIVYWKVASENAGGPPVGLNPAYNPDIHRVIGDRLTAAAWPPLRPPLTTSSTRR